MSNLIPMVSSSPPPLDDHSFGWEEEDDDFGNFVGGENPSESVSQKDHCSSNSPGVVDHSGKEGQGTDVHFPVNGSNDDFADFAKFEEFQENPGWDVVSPSKPQVGNLPLGSRLQDSPAPSEHRDNGQPESLAHPEEGARTITEENVEKEGSLVGKRDSTTDSGMFSTDLSPIPASEDTTAEFGDKSNDSDVDDNVPDLSPEKEMLDEMVEEEESTDKVDDDSVEQGCDDRDFSEDEQSLQDCDNSCSSIPKEEEDNAVKNVGSDSETCSSQTCDPGVTGVQALRDSLNDEAVSEGSASAPAKTERVAGTVEEEDESVSRRIHEVPSLEFRLDSYDEDDSATDGAEPSERLPVEEVTAVDASDTRPSNEKETSESRSPNGESMSPESVTSNEEEASQSRQDVSMPQGGMEENGVVPKEQDVENLEESNQTVEGGESDEGRTEVVCHREIQQEEESAASPIHSHCSTENVPVTVAETEEEEEEEEGWADFATFPVKGQPVEVVSHPPPEPPASRDALDSSSEDDFGDFSGGTTVPVSVQDSKQPGDSQDQSIRQNSASQPKGEEESDSDFGDFSAGQDSAQFGHSGQADVSQKAETGFTAFSENSAAAAEEDDDGWADFSATTPEQVPFGEDRESEKGFSKFRTSEPPSSFAVNQKLPPARLPDVFASCFPKLSELTESVLRGGLEEVLGELEETSRPGASSVSSGKGNLIWQKLKDLENCDALGYLWSTSLGNQCMFKTLRIDTKNILLGHKKQVVPIFAANIGLLEPIRGGAVKTEPAKEEITLVNPNPTEDTPSTQDIPPVEFDWDNSGLTNPLAEAQKRNVLAPSEEAAKNLDLDFLVQETETPGKSSVFQSEVLDAPRSSVKSMQPLEEILKSMKFTTTTPAAGRSRTEDLSEEAARIIDSLPDLSFMQAKVLMFPLRQMDFKN